MPDMSQVEPSQPVRATDDGSNSSGGPSANVNSVDRQAFGSSSSASFSRDASQTQVRIRSLLKMNQYSESLDCKYDHTFGSFCSPK